MSTGYPRLQQSLQASYLANCSASPVGKVIIYAISFSCSFFYWILLEKSIASLYLYVIHLISLFVISGCELLAPRSDCNLWRELSMRILTPIEPLSRHEFTGSIYCQPLPLVSFTSQHFDPWVEDTRCTLSGCYSLRSWVTLRRDYAVLPVPTDPLLIYCVYVIVCCSWRGHYVPSIYQLLRLHINISYNQIYYLLSSLCSW